MCGIAGAFDYGGSGSRPDRAGIEAACSQMIHRGPDGFGVEVLASGACVLGHRRLAIIDTSDRGLQPLFSTDGRLCITFNGEIYNYRDLRRELMDDGVQFRTETDTEIILELYRKLGLRFVEKLRGMYAFGIWDSVRSTLVLARDPFGIKPLYFTQSGGVITFASQVKALIAAGVKTTADAAGHVGFFLLGHVPEPFTLYKEIRALAPGSVLSVAQGGEVRIETVQRIRDIVRDQAEGAASTLREGLTDTVRHHLIADVDVGVFLSSGLDSSTLTALASEASTSAVPTVTLAFEEYLGTPADEAPLAEAIANHYGTAHRTERISRRLFDDELRRVWASMDQPTIDGLNTYLVSKVTASSGLKVAISGLGGDELFYGYSGFKTIPRVLPLAGRMHPMRHIGGWVRRNAEPLLRRFGRSKLAGVFEYGTEAAGIYLLYRSLNMPWQVPNMMDPDLFAAGWQELQLLDRLRDSVEGIADDVTKVAVLETEWYMRNQLLRDADWAGMSHSLEIRVPLVDVELLKTVTALRAESQPCTKLDMARTPLKPLPDAVLNRPKSGFSIPVQTWFRPENTPRNTGYRPWASHVYAQFTGNGYPA